MADRIGFIGLGAMGKPMAMNILKGGKRLTVFNRTASRTDKFRNTGARIAGSCEEVYENSDIVILMLTGPEAVRAMLPGSSESPSGTTIVNMSTVLPRFSKETADNLSERGIHFIDAPVLGSIAPAETGELLVLAGGSDPDIDGVQDIFDIVGKKTIRCGAIPKSAMMKLSVNLLLGAMFEGLAESVNFARKCGLDLEMLFDIILSGPLSTPVFEMKIPKLRDKDYSPQFAAKHMAKDLGFVVETAKDIGAGTPAAESNLRLFRQLADRGLSDQDVSAVIEALDG